VRLGAGLARLTGVPQLSVELPSRATLQDLLGSLEDDYPALSGGLDHALAVVDGSHAAPQERLQDGQEIALLYPTAGG
jgi:molybdopterin converting factor small subunit